MSKRVFVSLLLSISFALVLAACGGSDANTNSSNANSGNKAATNTTTTTTPTTTSTPAPTTNTTATNTTSGSGDKIGIAECDDYLEKYEACITTKVPAAARAQFNSALAQTRASWRQLASTTQGKAGLATACKMATEQTQKAMNPYGCSF